MTLNKMKFIALAGCLLISLLFPKEAIGMDNEDDKRRTVVQNILKAQRGSCIRTSNLFIAPLDESDLDAYTNIQKSDSLTPGRHFHTPLSSDILKGYVKATKDKKNILSDPAYPFRFYSVYCLDLTKRLNCSLIGFFVLSPLTMEMGMRNMGCSNLNYIIDPSFRNQGFGNEMLTAITTHLIPPLLKKTYPVMSGTEVLSNAPPMPFVTVRAFIDLDNIPSQKMALKSGFSPFDLTVDKGTEYQIEFRFPESKKSRISEEDQKLIPQLSDPQIKERFVELCRQRTNTRETEDDLGAQLFSGLLSSMGPKNLGMALKKAAKK